MKPQQTDQGLTGPGEAKGKSGAELAVVEATDADLQIVDMPGTGLIAIAPGQCVAMHRVSIPTKSDNQARRAAPFVIEDDVARDIQTLHVSIGSDDGNGSRLVGVVDHETMSVWTKSLEQLGSGNMALVPEQTLVQSADGELVIIDRGELVVAAYAQGLGCVIERDVFSHVIQGICAEHEIRHIRAYSDRPDRLTYHADTRQLPIKVSPALSPDAYLDMLRAGADSIPLNLLQGRYGTSVSMQELARKWLLPVCASLVLCVAYLTLLVVEGTSFRQQASQLDRDTEAVVRQSMPDVLRIVNPRTQIEARVRSLQGSDGDVFLALTSSLFEGLSRLQGARLDALQFDGPRLQLNATLSLQDYTEIEDLRDAIEVRGYSFQESSSRSNEGRISSDIRMGVP